MNYILTLALSTFLVTGRAAERLEIPLWPEGMPKPVVPANSPEKTEKGADGITRRWNVSQPRLFVHAPPEDGGRSGAALIVIPGGGFGRLADEHEGSDACAWATKRGIMAFQLAYRTPTSDHPEPNAGPVQDAQKAVELVRRRAAEFGLDSKKIGVLAFSAGGQVALVAASNERRFPGDATAGSHKPDFLLVIYPFQVYDAASKSLRADIRVEAGLPPMFIAQMGDDTASLPQGSAQLYLELVNRKIPAEIHIYERGGHGFGLRSRPQAVGPSDWPQRAADWLKLRGYAIGP